MCNPSPTACRHTEVYITQLGMCMPRILHDSASLCTVFLTLLGTYVRVTIVILCVCLCVCLSVCICHYASFHVPLVSR